MTAFLSRVDRTVSQIEEEAARLDPVRVVLTLLAVVPFVVGWLVRKATVAAWVVLSWAWTAALVGWRLAAPAKPEAGG
ncbi:MAG TPA: hypothetical protein VMU51_34205 [Mycobacteriales bacterium]|nr:hypothetical protein [Mycobacteriales bacterium]